MSCPLGSASPELCHLLASVGVGGRGRNVGSWWLLPAGTQTPKHVVSAAGQRRAGSCPSRKWLPQPRTHTPAQGRPGTHRTHLAAAEDVGRGDAHVEMLEHGLCLLPGLEGAVHGHAARSPDLGPELHASGAVRLQAQNLPSPSSGAKSLPLAHPGWDHSAGSAPTAICPTKDPKWGWPRGQAEAPLARGGSGGSRPRGPHLVGWQP